MTGPVIDAPSMFDSTDEHLADAAAGSLPAAAAVMMIDQENMTATATGRYDDSEPALDPAYIQTLQLLAEKKVREAEEKAKMDEEAEWFAAAEQSRDNQVAAAAAESEIGGSSNNITTSSTTEDKDIASEDILQSIEESVDYNNQTSGFVTSFALPLSPIVPASSEYIEDAKEEVDISDLDNERESLSKQSNDDQHNITSQQQRATSPASIFRTTSSSSSTSNRNRGMVSPSSPYHDDSIGSDSTEVADNASHSYISPTKKQPQHLPPLDHVDENDNVIKGEVVSPLASPMITTMKKSIQKSKSNAKEIKSNKEQVTTARRNKRKNNLVISPLPIKSKDREIPEATTTDGNSKTIVSNNKPPTHPSIKPSSSLSSQPITRTHSDADTSVDLSEATPITTPAKSSWFQGYSSEEDDEGDGGIRRSESKHLRPSVVDTNDDKGMDESTTDADHNQGQNVNQSPIDFEGLEIFDVNARALPLNDGITPKHNNLSTNNNANGINIIDNKASKRNESLNDSLNSSTEYTVSSFFNPKSNRQYHDENLFFNGIYESGLQSSSFEHVDNTAEDMMCTDAEIELVFNSSGVDQPSFLVNDDTDSSFASSSVVTDDLEECASVEERREVVRRIQQWRRGRARENSIDANADRVDECDTEQDKNVFNFHDDDDDAIEMTPLTAAKIDDSVSIGGNNSNGNGKSSIYSTNNFSWNHAFFGNLLQQIQPSHDEYSSNRRGRKPRYDDIDFDRNTDKCFSCFSRWKKLMIVCTVILLFGSLISGDGLEKHNKSGSYSDYREDDPLAKSNFIEHGRIPDDTDDYDGLLSYHYSGIPTPLRNDYDNVYSYQQPAKSDVLMDDVWLHFEMEDDEFDTPMIGALEWPDQNDESSNSPKSYATQSHLVSSGQYNKLVGIDTIVVLGDHHSGLDWLVTKLNQLYPDLIIKIGFHGEVERNGRSLKETTSHLRRKTKVVDPLSNEVIHHLSGADALGEEDGKSNTGHILVISLFLNPYDWFALMHSSPKMYEKSWRDYLETEWESYSNILEYRANMISSAVIKSMERDDVKLVMPLKYEKLLGPFGNFDNYISSSSQEEFALPGIVGMIDDIQSHTGLRADDTVGWKEPRDHNPFWADDIGCTGHICHPQIQKLRKDAEYVTYINEHLDWKAESLIGYQQMMTPKPAVDQIVVLGERHSGAEWLVDRLSRCYPDVNVKYGFESRPGKFFQTEPTNAQPATLVISIFLNPFDWVDMMRRNPINAPTHKNLEWTDFVTRRWERKRSKMDENLDDADNAVCSFGFSYNEVIPCMTQRDPNTDSFPLYELRTDGTSYTNLLELREDKIKNFLGTANFAAVVDHIPVRYEDLVWDDDYTDDAMYLTLPFPGIAGLLEKIRDQTKLVPDIDAGWILDEDGIFRAEKLGVGVNGLDPYFVQWMEDNVDWDVEDLVGYFP